MLSSMQIAAMPAASYSSTQRMTLIGVAVAVVAVGDDRAATSLFIILAAWRFSAIVRMFASGHRVARGDLEAGSPEPVEACLLADLRGEPVVRADDDDRPGAGHEFAQLPGFGHVSSTPPRGVAIHARRATASACAGAVRVPGERRPVVTARGQLRGAPDLALLPEEPGLRTGPALTPFASARQWQGTTGADDREGGGARSAARGRARCGGA